MQRHAETTPADDATAADDLGRLHAMGYAQELARRLGGFSNFALSLSIICILAGGVTSFHMGLCSVGGASIGLGWPLVSLFALAVAATMGQLASTFPTAGGLYHWSAILGGRGWGWTTAWFNLAGLITVLAAINVGTYRFAMAAIGTRPDAGASSTWRPRRWRRPHHRVAGGDQPPGHRRDGAADRFQRLLDPLHRRGADGRPAGIRPGPGPDKTGHLREFQRTGGPDVWPATEGLAILFALGMLLPAYTITGFDASAHASEETIGASASVPRGIVRSVLVSGVAGWIFLSAVVLAAPSVSRAAAQGEGAFLWILTGVLPRPMVVALCVGIVVAQYLCGLATVTSASRMAYAFARDGGLPFSSAVRWVCPRRRSPAVAIWGVAAVSVLFTLHTPVYSTITAVCTILLYVSYVLPAALGAWAYGRTWTAMGPWDLGRWYRPLALLSVAVCVALIVIGMQPPNERSTWVVGAFAMVLAAAWFGGVRHSFPGPPAAALVGHRQTAAIPAMIKVSPDEDRDPAGKHHGPIARD